MKEEKTIEGEIVEEPTTAIVPHMIRPIVSVDEALKGWKEYQALKTKLADKGDFVKIQNKEHPTKQFAKKLQKFFGLSTEIIEMHKEGDDNVFTWYVTARATAPNGQFNDGDGACSSDERGFAHKMHDVRATAVTRAKNRAILELAGFGEVSAEEITEEDTQSKPPLESGDASSKKRGGQKSSSRRQDELDSASLSPSPTPKASNGTNEELTEAIKEKLREANITESMERKLFKPWLSSQRIMNKKTGKYRIFLGDNYGNLSFTKAEHEDLKFLYKVMNKVIEDFYKEVLPQEERK